MVIDERPDLFYAYIGSGQMVNPKLTDQRIYEDLLAEARLRRRRSGRAIGGLRAASI
ncbi:MAG: hypothetical protein R2839_00560 [Thermomicrobiales bacterium]